MCSRIMRGAGTSVGRCRCLIRSISKDVTTEDNWTCSWAVLNSRCHGTLGQVVVERRFTRISLPFSLSSQNLCPFVRTSNYELHLTVVRLSVPNVCAPFIILCAKHLLSTDHKTLFFRRESQMLTNSIFICTAAHALIRQGLQIIIHSSRASPAMSLPQPARGRRRCKRTIAIPIQRLKASHTIFPPADASSRFLPEAVCIARLTRNIRQDTITVHITIIVIIHT